MAATDAGAPPRVHLTYTVEDDGGREERELAFVVGVIADFAPVSAKPRPPLAQRQFITVNERTIDAVVAGLAPTLTLRVADHLGRRGGQRVLALAFTRMADFHPEALAQQTPELRALVALRAALAVAKRALWTAASGRGGDGDGDGAQALDRLERLSDPRALFDDENPDGAGVGLDDVAALTRGMPAEWRSAATATLDRRIVEIDALLGEQLDAILHAPAFQSLEATWRGLEFLVRQVKTGSRLMVKILPMSLEELRDDLDHAATRSNGGVDLERRQSTLYDILYTREYGQFGGEPVGVLVIDHAFSGAPEDIDLLHLLSVIAADAHMPILAGASPRLVGLEDFTELGERPVDLAANFASGVGTSKRWQALRRRESSRYLGLALPRALARSPHRPDPARAQAFAYEETAVSRDEHVWMSAVYPLAARIAWAFERYGWCVAFTGLEGGGGIVDSLPLPDFGLGDETQAPLSPLEVQLTEEQEQALVDAGLIALMAVHGQDFAVFYSVRSAHDPLPLRDPAAALSARLSSRLPFMFAASRVAHYLKVMTRESVGRSRSRIEIESDLNRWIAQYITYQDDASQEARARRPLRDGSVTLVDIEGEPGRYLAEVMLQPHFQIEEINFSLQLKTMLHSGAS